MKEFLDRTGYVLMGAAFEVYNDLGFGLVKSLYQEALERELTERELDFVAPCPLKVYFKEKLLSQQFEANMVISNYVLAEMRSVRDLLPEHEAETLNHMRIARLPLGYLVNFGRPGGVQWKRFTFDEFLPGGGEDEEEEDES